MRARAGGGAAIECSPQAIVYQTTLFGCCLQILNPRYAHIGEDVVFSQANQSVTTERMNDHKSVVRYMMCTPSYLDL